jgi:hypothetical protein
MKMCYGVIKPRRGRLSLVIDIPGHNGRPKAHLSLGLHKTRVFSYDSNDWVRNWREEWDEEEWQEAEAKGLILVRPCPREEATHVSHYAICGGFERIDRLKRTHTMCWPEDSVAEEEESHKLRIAHVDRFDIYPTRP